MYFPAGANWTDYWRADPTVHVGGSRVTLPTSDATIPLFQRVGSVIPLLEMDGGQSVLTLRLDSCAEGSSLRTTSTVYDDDGVSTRSAAFVLEVTSECAAEGAGSWSASVREGAWVPEWGGTIRFELRGQAVAEWSHVLCNGHTIPYLGSAAGALRALPSAVFGWVRGEGGVVTVAAALSPSAGSSVRCTALSQGGIR